MPWDLDHPYTILKDANRFRISDMDTSGDPSYYGFVDKNGEWLIMEKNTGNSTFRYARGSSDYPGNWGGRGLLTYSYYDEVF